MLIFCLCETRGGGDLKIVSKTWKMSSCFKLRISEIFAPEAILIFGKLCQQSWLSIIQTFEVLTVDSVIIFQNNYFYKYSRTIIPLYWPSLGSYIPGVLRGVTELLIWNPNHRQRSLPILTQIDQIITTLQTRINTKYSIYFIEEQKLKILLFRENEGGYGRCLGEFGLRILVLWKFKYLEVFLSVVIDRNPHE